MDDKLKRNQFHMDEVERRTDDFLRREFEAELAAIRAAKSASFTRITEVSAALLPQSSLRLTSTDESAVPDSEDSALPLTLAARPSGLHIRRWTVTTIAAAAVVILGLTVMISIYSGNKAGMSNNDNIASSKDRVSDSPLPAVEDDTLALDFNAMERDLDRLQSDLNDSPVGENDSYLAASQLDDAINQFEADLETF